MTARVYHREHTFSGSTVMEATEVFDQYEQELFTAVVAVAEKEGKPVSLLVVPATNVFDAIVVTAQRLDSSKIACGLSNKLTADEQAKLTGMRGSGFLNHVLGSSSKLYPQTAILLFTCSGHIRHACVNKT